jgi:hypothetical protein
VDLSHTIGFEINGHPQMDLDLHGIPAGYGQTGALIKGVPYSHPPEPIGNCFLRASLYSTLRGWDEALGTADPPTPRPVPLSIGRPLQQSDQASLAWESTHHGAETQEGSRNSAGAFVPQTLQPCGGQRLLLALRFELSTFQRSSFFASWPVEQRALGLLLARGEFD